MQRYLFIALGGALGAILRYLISFAVTGRFGPRFPLGTLVHRNGRHRHDRLQETTVIKPSVPATA